MSEAVTVDRAAPAPLVDRACPICLQTNETTRTSRYARAGWRLVECSGCGFVHLASVPATERLVEEFAWQKTFAEEGKARKRRYPVIARLDGVTRWRLRLFPRASEVALLKKTAPPGPVVDVGCGGGGYLADLADAFSPLHGVEISRELATIAQAKIGDGGIIRHGPAVEALDGFPDDYFSAALMRSYLEHDWQAREVLAVLQRKLRLGGCVVVKVPNYGSLNRRVMGSAWCGFRFPDHVNYFTRRTLIALVEPMGFQARFPLFRNLPTDDNFVAVLTRNS